MIWVKCNECGIAAIGVHQIPEARAACEACGSVYEISGREQTESGGVWVYAHRLEHEREDVQFSSTCSICGYWPLKWEEAEQVYTKRNEEGKAYVKAYLCPVCNRFEREPRKSIRQMLAIVANRLGAEIRRCTGHDRD